MQGMNSFNKLTGLAEFFSENEQKEGIRSNPYSPLQEGFEEENSPESFEGKKRYLPEYELQKELKGFAESKAESVFFNKLCIRQCFEKLSFRGDASSIYGREEEVEFILGSLQGQRSQTRPLLMGPEGIGKHSIIVKASTYLQNRKIIQVNCRKLATFLDTDGWSSSVQAFYEQIEEKMQNSNCILYLRNINALFTQDTNRIGMLHYLFTSSHHMIATSWTLGSCGIDNTVLQTLKQFGFFEQTIRALDIDRLQEIVFIHFHRQFQNAAMTREVLNWSVLGCKKYLQAQTERDIFQVLVSAFYKAEEETASSRRGRKRVQKRKEGRKIISISKKNVAKILSERTNIPLERITSPSRDLLNSIEQQLKGFIIGQQEGIDAIMPKVRLWITSLRNPEKPPGSILIAGPTGVGKTHFAEIFQKTLFPGSEKALIVINGGEYQEEGTISKLIGTSQGYIGYGQSAILHPLCSDSHKVVLIDEIEKMHRRVLDLFLAVFDKGTFQDGTGKQIECRHTWFIATTNAGAKLLKRVNEDGEEQFTVDTWNYADRQRRLMDELQSFDERGEPRYFRQELLGRMTVVAFRSLFPNELADVAKLSLEGMKKNMKQNNGIEISWERGVLDFLTSIVYEEQLGMRSFERKIEECVLEAFLKLDLFEEDDKRLPICLSVQEGSLVFLTARALL